jgi:hypothetical protein
MRLHEFAGSEFGAFGVFPRQMSTATQSTVKVHNVSFFAICVVSVLYSTPTTLRSKNHAHNIEVQFV